MIFTIVQCSGQRVCTACAHGLPQRCVEAAFEVDADGGVPLVPECREKMRHAFDPSHGSKPELVFEALRRVLGCLLAQRALEGPLEQR